MADSVAEDKVSPMVTEHIGIAPMEKAFPEGRALLRSGGEDMGFITPVMKEGEFDAKCAELGDAVLGCLRIL